MTIITKVYKVLLKTTDEIHKFETQLTEREFYNTLDGVYGIDKWEILDETLKMN